MQNVYVFQRNEISSLYFLTACVSVMPMLFRDHNVYRSQTPGPMSHSTAGFHVIVDAGQKLYVLHFYKLSQVHLTPFHRLAPTRRPDQAPD